MSRTRDDRRKAAQVRKRRAAIPGEQARQGTIVLRTPLRRAIFIGGFLAIIILGLVLAVI